MATNFVDVGSVDIVARRSNITFEHRFFLAVAILFPLITVIGFVPNYIFDTPVKPPRATPILIAHIISMCLWIVLFSVQACLVSAKKIKLHITLGMFGIVLAGAVMVSGTLAAFASAARGASFPGFSPTEFFMIPLGDLVTFAILFGAALYYRKNAANHKRLMLVTVLNFLPPSIGRLPFPFIPDLGAIWLLGVPALLAILLLVGDTRRTGKLNRAFAGGITVLLLSGILRFALCRTETWNQFAAWVLS